MKIDRWEIAGLTVIALIIGASFKLAYICTDWCDLIP